MHVYHLHQQDVLCERDFCTGFFASKELLGNVPFVLSTDIRHTKVDVRTLVQHFKLE